MALAVPLTTACARLVGARSIARARGGATTFHTVRVDGRERSFLLHLPPAASRGVPLPLVVALHGHTGNANTIRQESALDAAADRAGYVVAYPNGTGILRVAVLSWNAGACCGWAHRHAVDDVAFIGALADTLAAHALVDRRRVYAAGFSSGGTLALLLACGSRPVVAGIVSVSGTMPEAPCTPSSRVAVMLLAGDGDDELARDHAENAAHGAPLYARSFEAARAFWSARDGCAGTAVESTPALVTTRSLGCAPGAEVEQVVVRGQRHAWPGGEKPWWFSPTPSPLDGAGLALDFFSRQAAALAASRSRRAHDGRQP